MLKITRTILLQTLAITCLGGCAIKPHAATDPAYIAAFQAERLHWDRLARQTYTGMTRAEVEHILPPDTSLPGITGGAAWISKGKSRSQAHTEEWYFVSSHFICNIEYDFTGLKYDSGPETGLLEDTPEFPSSFVRGSDPSQQVALTGATITLVEARRVKKAK
jgi:hypothetical protein